MPVSSMPKHRHNCSSPDALDFIAHTSESRDFQQDEFDYGEDFSPDPPGYEIMGAEEQAKQRREIEKISVVDIQMEDYHYDP